MTNEDIKNLEATLWKSADTLRANTDLKSTEYSTQVLGLIFLRFADNKYSLYEKEILKEYERLKGTRREKPISKIAIEKCGFYLPDHARYDYLLNLPEEEEIDKKIKKAMESIEEYKEELRGILPQDEYFRLIRTDKTIPNANYLWINIFATSLKTTGRAALVMANSASDARHSEADIRKTLIEKNLIYAMLTLPSNMFYTVTLPATLWFFHRAKQDDRILFIDARNIFTQIDRAHREFSEEQIQNIAVINRLHKGKRGDFIKLIHGYFEQGMEKLNENKENLESVSETLINYLKVLKENNYPDFSGKLRAIQNLDKKYKAYHDKFSDKHLDKTNNAQRSLAEAFTPFFSDIHDMLRSIDKKVRHLEKDHPDKKATKAFKLELEALHREFKDTEYFFSHIHWLQERFPEACYEDVTGQCKLASMDEIREQDYSLNPGRYVGVVIEEDGKSEEEFIEEILTLNQELNDLNKEARALEKIINHNILELTGEK